jgi:hypothetical protein
MDFYIGFGWRIEYVGVRAGTSGNSPAFVESVQGAKR